MDNRHITVQSEGRKAFELAMQLLFDNAPGGKVSHYSDHPTYGFVLFWDGDEDYLSEASYDAHDLKKEKVTSPIVKLPYAMNCKAATDLAWEWLQAQPNDKYQDQCDHDGSNGKGFKVYNEYWGHIGDSHYSVLAVLPVWAWYGK
jgi:hypothetical protein